MLGTTFMRNVTQANPLWQEQATIPGLPPNLRNVPNDPERWRLWMRSVNAYRRKRRRECAADMRQQEVERERCRRDPVYFICVWGVIFEPRTVEEEPPQWRPFILFPFQVHAVRWIQQVMATTTKGRGDGVVEKSRDMGMTNLFCGYIAHQFIFADVFICGIISRNFDQVYKKNTSDTIFAKVEALLGLEDGLPPELKLPTFLKPAGFQRALHCAPGAIKNPEQGKMCFIVGETTTKLSGVGGRSTMRLNDEAARFDAFGETWSNQQATTDHRFAVSSADLRSPEFYNLARLGEQCLTDPDKPGPSALRLDWWLHPFHTPQWFQDQKDRAQAEGDPHKFAREYEIDYFAGQGQEVYPRFRNVTAENVPYDPYGGPVMCWVDPGIRDPAALIYVQEDRPAGTWNVINGFQGKGGEDVMFYASVMSGVYLSGERGYDYDDYDGIHRFMEFTASITQPITYIGDPAGNQRGAGGDEASTWYQQLSIASRQLATKTIFVHAITGNDARAYTPRIQAVNELLPKIRFDRNPGAVQVLHALQNSRYPDAKRAERHEPLKPLHDAKFSHIRSAFEYGCVWLQRVGMTSGMARPKPVRRSLAGNLVSGRTRDLTVRR